MVLWSEDVSSIGDRMIEVCDYSGLFNTLHIVFLFVLYIGAIKYIKDSIILREFLVSNKYSVRRRYFFEVLRRYLRANLSYCVIVVIIISAYTCLMLIPLVTDFFLIE